ncbi:MAG: hypothetical protein CMJ81_24210 [Planctomycetaceae bacterium]|nr:hypothetical protein [Planctomycetaceae bacterium]
MFLLTYPLAFDFARLLENVFCFLRSHTRNRAGTLGAGVSSVAPEWGWSGGRAGITVTGHSVHGAGSSTSFDS